MFKLDIEKGEEPEVKLPASAGSSKKQGISRKTSTSASLTMVKSLTVWITTNCGKFLKRRLLRNLHGSQEAIEPDKEQWTGSKF